MLDGSGQRLHRRLMGHADLVEARALVPDWLPLAPRVRQQLPVIWTRMIAVQFGATLAALLLVHSPAQAAIDCWIDAEHPQTADQRPATDPRVAPMRQALHTLNAQLRRMPALHALPETRLRSSWQIAGQWDAPARAGNFLLRDHRRKVWTGRCDVLRGADRLEPRATVVARFNAPEAFFATTAPELDDEQLRAWRELPATGQVNGHTLYAGRMLVFTRSGRLPWVAVSTAEYADFTLRDLQRRIDETRAPLAALAARTTASPAAREAEDEAQLQRVAAGLRQVDPAAAERLITEMRAQLAQQRAAEDARTRARAARAAPSGHGADPDPLITMLARVRAWRAGLSAQQLAAPARLGINGLHADSPALQNAPRLVKPDPDFDWDRAHPAQPQMLMLSLIGGEEFEQPMQRVLQTLDLGALQALVRPPAH